MLAKGCISLINIYQSCVRSILPCSCRFMPTCSDYAKDAFYKYGFLKGSGMVLLRIARCHPFSEKSGYDPLL